MRISCCNGEKITMSIAYLQKNIIFAVAILTRSRATNRNLLIMRHIAHLLQSRIGGGKSLNSNCPVSKSATAITCGRTVLWMFFLFCALFTTVSRSDGDAADDALSAIDTPPAAEAAPVYDLLQGTWEAS